MLNTSWLKSNRTVSFHWPMAQYWLSWLIDKRTIFKIEVLNKNNCARKKQSIADTWKKVFKTNCFNTSTDSKNVTYLFWTIKAIKTATDSESFNFFLLSASAIVFRPLMTCSMMCRLSYCHSDSQYPSRRSSLTNCFLYHLSNFRATSTVLGSLLSSSLHHLTFLRNLKEKHFTLSFIRLKKGQTYFKNLVVSTLKDF